FGDALEELCLLVSPTGVGKRQLKSGTLRRCDRVLPLSDCRLVGGGCCHRLSYGRAKQSEPQQRCPGEALQAGAGERSVCAKHVLTCELWRFWHPALFP